MVANKTEARQLLSSMEAAKLTQEKQVAFDAKYPGAQESAPKIKKCDALMKARCTFASFHSEHLSQLYSQRAASNSDLMWLLEKLFHRGTVASDNI